MAAAQYVQRPGYAALLLRKSYADLALPSAIMARSKEWWGGTAAQWDGVEHVWHFPEGGKIAFGYLDHADDKYRYQSAEFQFVGFDELTQFREEDYLYLHSRLRRLTGVDIPLRMRGATNPGGFGHDWVLRRFMMEGKLKGCSHCGSAYAWDQELCTACYKPTDPEYPQPARPFIPAKLQDNPSIDEVTYLRSLMQLDPFTRQQLLEGNWFARPPGRKFRKEWFDIVEQVPREAERIRWWDMAATEEPKRRVGAKLTSRDPDYTAGLLLARTAQGIYYIEDIVRGRWKPHEAESVVVNTAHRDASRYSNLGFEIWMEQEPGSSGKYATEHFRLLLDGYAFFGLPSTGLKEIRANPASSAAGAHNIKLVQGAWISDFLNEAEQFPDPNVHDDQIDCLSGAFNILARRGAVSSDDWALGIWRCQSCPPQPDGTQFGFFWQPGRSCPQCGTPAPMEYPQPYRQEAHIADAAAVLQEATAVQPDYDPDVVMIIPQAKKLKYCIHGLTLCGVCNLQR